jgi:dTDP-4-dehydrorhamnose reductase
MARFLVTGAGGMLGTDLCAVLERAGHDVTSGGPPGLDVTDPVACSEWAVGHDIVVNCAAYTAVDAAEEHEAVAFAVNATGAANLARAAHGAGASLVHVSTDYVFDGESDRPYLPDTPLAPRSAYGRTKAAGEWAVRAECSRTWLVRTAWLYGAHGRSIPATVARLAAERDTLSFVADQVGQPTWTVDVAEAVLRLVEADAPFGVWHATNGGQTSWFGLARAVLEELGEDPERVRPIATSDHPSPAPRPAYSVLSHTMWVEQGLAPPPDWRDALHRAAPALFGEASPT